MVIEVLLITLTLIVLTIASITDIRTKEVPDWLSYAFLASVIFLKILDVLLFHNFKSFLLGMLGFAIFFAIGNFMYYTRQWGGGDAKLLMGMGVALNPYPSLLLSYTTPNLNIPFLLIIVLNILIIGAVYGIIAALFLALKHRDKVKKEIYTILKTNRKSQVLLLIISALFLILSLIITKDPFLRMVSLVLIAFFICFMYLLVFIRAVEQGTMYKNLSTKKLAEGDWIVHPILLKKKLIYSPKSLGVTKKQILLIQKARIKSVLVKEGIPFIPPFLIATILSLIFGNLLF